MSETWWQSPSVEQAPGMPQLSAWDVRDALPVTLMAPVDWDVIPQGCRHRELGDQAN